MNGLYHRVFRRFLNKKKCLNNVKLSCSAQAWGEEMAEFLWYWERGNIRIYTKNRNLAEEAMRKGFLIFGKRVKPKVFFGRK